MCEIPIPKINEIVKGKIVREIKQYEDCIGQTFLIIFTDNSNLEINRNDDNEFFMIVYDKDNNQVSTQRPW